MEILILLLVSAVGSESSFPEKYAIRSCYHAKDFSFLLMFYFFFILNLDCDIKLNKSYFQEKWEFWSNKGLEFSLSSNNLQ